MSSAHQSTRDDSRSEHTLASKLQPVLMSDETFTQAIAENCIVISGNISAGKSTLVDRFEEAVPHAVAVREPVESNLFLDAFDKNPKEVAYEMQKYLFAKRMVDYQHATTHAHASHQHRRIVFDRSVFDDQVFARYNAKIGNISACDFDEYMQRWRDMVHSLQKPVLVVYLRTQPRTCYERIKARDRPCEKNITLDYLQGLHESYEMFIDEMERHGVNVLRIEWDTFGELDALIQRIVAATGTSV